VPAQSCAALGLVFERQTNCKLLDTVFTNTIGDVHITHLSGSFAQKCRRGKAISVTYYECVCSLKYPACSAYAPYSHLWLARPYNIFQHYLINDTILEKQLLVIEFVIYLYNVCLKHFYSEKNRARYDEQ
jgi:hypothetical protein